MDQPVIIFDGVCNFCNRSVNFIMDHDPGEAFRFAPNQSAVGQRLLRRCGLPTENVGSMVLVEGERCSRKSTASLRIARRMRFPWNLAYVFILVPRPVRDLAYDVIARNRYRWFGRADACRLPTERDRRRFLEGAEVVEAPSVVEEPAGVG